jgi:hypothetical protein
MPHFTALSAFSMLLLLYPCQTIRSTATGHTYIYMACGTCIALDGTREHWWSVLVESPLSAITTGLLIGALCALT